MESLDQCRRLKVREKARSVFCDEPTSVWPHGVTQHRIFIKFFSDFTRIFSLFSLVFRTSNFWSLRNLIKPLLHSRLLDMRLVIAISYPTRAHGLIVNYHYFFYTSICLHLPTRTKINTIIFIIIIIIIIIISSSLLLLLLLLTSLLLCSLAVTWWRARK